MQLKYRIIIEKPENHLLKVEITGSKRPNQSCLKFFLPNWSPGSYLLREYGKHIRNFQAQDKDGLRLFHEQVDTGSFEVYWDHNEFKSSNDSFKISYEVYCHELTVRTSHMDITHAFLHGPTIFMGVENEDLKSPQVEIEFPPLWSKLSTSLKDISSKREVFLYEAADYDHLIDCPIEIGCHETDGFMFEGKEHHLVYFGENLPNDHNIKNDTKKIVETVFNYFGEIPYDHYYFINHFLPSLFGGLEHRDSTALQYCSKEMATKKGYQDYLSLVAHEYFHTWNVKRIRPRELGPFNYRKENFTKMLWLAEGLTVFMDDLTVYKADLCSLEDYLEMRVKSLNRYFEIPGKKYHSLEESSFNAWIKLYRADEFTNNSSISYYLKGGIVFFCLNVMLVEKGRSIKDLLKLLWDRYKSNPDQGVDTNEVLEMIESISDKSTRDTFYHMIATTDDIDLENYYSRAGLKFEYESEKKVVPGFVASFKGDRVFVKEVIEDSSAYKSGINAGDEIISINNQRFLKNDYDQFSRYFDSNKSYRLMVNRLGKMLEFDYLPGNSTPKLLKISVTDKDKCLKTLKEW